MEAPRARALLVGAFLLALAVFIHPHDTVIPVDPADWDDDIGLQVGIHRLDDRERILLTAWLGYAALTWHRGDRIRPGTTIGDAMRAQRDFQREEYARRQLEKKLGRLLPIITTNSVLYRLSKPSHGSL